MSFDTPEENRAFKEKYDFPFRLLSDTDRSVGDVYGAARPADHDFAAFARRVSFLIDPEGKVARTYEVGDVAAHAAEVLRDLDAEQAG